MNAALIDPNALAAACEQEDWALAANLIAAHDAAVRASVHQGAAHAIPLEDLLRTHVALGAELRARQEAVAARLVGLYRAGNASQAYRR